MHSIWYQMLKIASARPRWGEGGDLRRFPYRLSIVDRNFLPSAISPLCTINASILQVSGLGPIDFVIAISSLKPKYSRNRLPKYADDSNCNCNYDHLYSVVGSKL